jgi:hypothetical protein
MVNNVSSWDFPPKKLNPLRLDQRNEFQNNPKVFILF